jgi:hypothetical protein
MEIRFYTLQTRSGSHYFATKRSITVTLGLDYRTVLGPTALLPNADITVTLGLGYRPVLDPATFRPNADITVTLGLCYRTVLGPTAL